MKTLTLVTKRLYFGIDPLRLREASGRVLARIHGLAPSRASISADDLRRDFGLDTVVGRTHRGGDGRRRPAAAALVGTVRIPAHRALRRVRERAGRRAAAALARPGAGGACLRTGEGDQRRLDAQSAGGRGPRAVRRLPVARTAPGRVAARRRAADATGFAPCALSHAAQGRWRARRARARSRPCRRSRRSVSPPTSTNSRSPARSSSRPKATRQPDRGPHRARQDVKIVATPEPFG